MNVRRIKPIIEPMDRFLGGSDLNWSLVLAPDRNQMCIVAPEELYATQESLTAEVAATSVPSPADTCRQVSLLVNSRCNFHCSYCYAAQSRTDSELSAKRVEQFLDQWMSNPAWPSGTELEISFSGGGEPMLSMREIAKIVSSALAIAEKRERRLRFSMATNGSLLASETLDYLKRHRFHIFFSFELLEDLQRSQRGVWQPVKDNLLKVLRLKIPCTVKCVITRLSMSRQLEMAECAIRDFPELRRLTFNQMELIARQCSLAEYREYLDEAIPGFFAARRFAARHGVSVSSYDFQRMSNRSGRCCPVPPVIAPHGGIAFCTAASSPREELYPFVAVGEISLSGKVSVDESRLTKLREYRADADPHCQCCAAREFCGGGCPVARHLYSPSQMREYCAGRRRFLAFMALEHAESRLRKSGIPSISKWLASKPVAKERTFSL